MHMSYGNYKDVLPILIFSWVNLLFLFYFLQYPIFIKTKVGIFLFVISVFPWSQNMTICHQDKIVQNNSFPVSHTNYSGCLSDLILTLETMIEMLTKEMAYTFCFLSYNNFRGKVRLGKEWRNGKVIFKMVHRKIFMSLKEMSLIFYSVISMSDCH